MKKNRDILSEFTTIPAAKGLPMCFPRYFAPTELMKHIHATALIIILLLVNCGHFPGLDPAYMSEGHILGEDMSMCMFCGGWFIEIDGITYRFDELPGDSGIDLENETFPIHVRLNWSADTIPTWIIIEDIEKI